jgi:predicted nucleic acid-binding protein
LSTTGTIGLIRSAKELGLLQVIRATLDALIETGFRVNPAIIAHVLVEVGERS